MKSDILLSMAEDPIEEREEEREDEEEMFLGEDDLDVPDISSSSKLTQADCSIFHRVSVSTGGDCQHTSLENTAAQCAVQCAVCSVHCSVWSVQCSVCSVQCAVFNMRCAACRVQCAVYSVHCTRHRFTRMTHLVFPQLNEFVCSRFLEI